MDDKRLRELAGISPLTEGAKFKDAGHMLRSLLNDLREVLNAFEDVKDEDMLEEIIQKYEDASVG